MYTTNEAIELLIKNELGLTFKMVGNENIHIFKCIDNKICKGEYGDGLIVDLKDGMYTFELWEIDYEESC